MRTFNIQLIALEATIAGLVVSETVNDSGLKMPSPSKTEFYSSTPDTSSTPSTSAQPTVGSSPPSIEIDPNTPSEEPTIRPPLSSIELDPNNPPPEILPSQNNEGPVKKEVTFWQKLNIQLPSWKQHLHEFRYGVGFSTCFAVLAVASCITGYLTQMKNLWFGITCASSFVCFAYIWLMIPSGPPFMGDKDGNAIKPGYLRPQKLSESSRNLMSSSQLKQLREEELYARQQGQHTK